MGYEFLRKNAYLVLSFILYSLYINSFRNLLINLKKINK
jgi:hypothetical protein